MAQIIVLTLLVLAFGWAIYRTFLKKGGCCGNCSSCGGCHSSCGDEEEPGGHSCTHEDGHACRCSNRNAHRR